MGGKEKEDGASGKEGKEEVPRRPSFAQSRWRKARTKVKAALCLKGAANKAKPAAPGDDEDALEQTLSETVRKENDVEAILEYATSLMEKGVVKNEINESKKKKPSLRNQVNPEYYTKEALEQRRSIRNAPEFTQAVEAFWNTVPRHVRGVDRGMYILIFSAMGSDDALIPDSPTPEEAARMLEREWAYDSQGIEWLDLAAFTDAVFDLVDTWCDGIEVAQYAEFVMKMVQRLGEMHLPTVHPGEWHWQHPKDNPEQWRKCGQAMGQHLETAFSKDHRDTVPLPGLYVDPLATACQNVTADFLNMSLLVGNAVSTGATIYRLRRVCQRPKYTRRGFPGWERGEESISRAGSLVLSRRGSRMSDCSLLGSPRGSPRGPSPVRLGSSLNASMLNGTQDDLLLSASGSMKRRMSGLSPTFRKRSTQWPGTGEVHLQIGDTAFVVPATVMAKFPSHLVADLLQQGGGESSPAEPLVLPGNPDVLQAVLNFLMTGTIPTVDPATAGDLLRAWEEWGLPLSALVPPVSQLACVRVNIFGVKTYSKGKMGTKELTKLLEESTPDVQITTDTTQREGFEGLYTVMPGTFRENQPVWSCQQMRLYSVKGYWVVGTAEEMTRGVGSLSSVQAHAGRLPSYPGFKWRVCQPDTSVWKTDDAVHVTGNEVPEELHVRADDAPEYDGKYRRVPGSAPWPLWEDHSKKHWLFCTERGGWGLTTSRAEAEGHGPGELQSERHLGEMPSSVTGWTRQAPSDQSEGEAPTTATRVTIAKTKRDLSRNPRRLLKVVPATSLLAHPDTALGRRALEAVLSLPSLSQGVPAAVDIEAPIMSEEMLLNALQFYQNGNVTLAPVDAGALQATLRILGGVYRIPRSIVKVAGPCQLFGFGYGGCPEKLKPSNDHDSNIPHSQSGVCLRCARPASDLLEDLDPPLHATSRSSPSSPTSSPSSKPRLSPIEQSHSQTGDSLGRGASKSRFPVPRPSPAPSPTAGTAAHLRKTPSPDPSPTSGETSGSPTYALRLSRRRNTVEAQAFLESSVSSSASRSPSASPVSSSRRRSAGSPFVPLSRRSPSPASPSDLRRHRTLTPLQPRS